MLGILRFDPFSRKRAALAGHFVFDFYSQFKLTEGYYTGLSEGVELWYYFVRRTDRGLCLLSIVPTKSTTGLEQLERET